METRTFDFSLLAPILSVAIGALLVLLAEVLLYPPRQGENDPGGGSGGKASGPLLALISSTALVVAIFFSWRAFETGLERNFDSLRPMLHVDPFSNLGAAIVGLGALLSVWLAATHLSLRRIEHGESQALLLLSTAGMFVLMASSDLLSSYLGVELMCVPLYVLAAFDRRSKRSSEAGLDAVLTGCFASALLLYGMALLYGAVGSTDFAALAASPHASSPLALAGTGLVVAALVIKLGAAPFHQWLFGVYEGAPASVSSFMMVTGTLTLFVTLARFLALQPPEVGDRVLPALELLALLSLVVAGGMAFVQTRVKRILGYASLSYAGFALLALSVATAQAYAALLFTSFVFVFMMVGVFGVLVALARDGEACNTLDDLAGLADRRSGLAAALTLFLLALAGAPGTGAFVGKFMILSAAVDSGSIALTLAVAFASGMTAVCHVRVVAVLYMTADADEAIELQGADEGEDSPTQEMSSLDLGLLAVCAVAVVALGLAPSLTPFQTAAGSLAIPGAFESPLELPTSQDADVALSARDVEFVE